MRRRILIARRAEEIAPFIVMEVLERARELERQGVDVIHLEVGSRISMSLSGQGGE